jgi:hypothetical protein
MSYTNRIVRPFQFLLNEDSMTEIRIVSRRPARLLVDRIRQQEPIYVQTTMQGVLPWGEHHWAITITPPIVPQPDTELFSERKEDR